MVVAARGLSRLAAILIRERPDLVYLHMASDGSFWRKAIASVMARCARVPYVVHVHGGGFAEFYRRLPAPGRMIARWVLGGARAVITLTPSWAREIGVIAGRDTVTIPNPVSVPAEVADPSARPARVVTLARLGASKGTFTLIRAFGALAAAHPDSRLVLAGDGPQEEARRVAREEGVEDRVEMPGWIGPAERDALLARATVFVLPSRIEGLPVSMLEAMAHGLPVVVTPVGGIPDAIEDGVTGRLVPPDDVDALAVAIGALLDAPQAAAQMGAAARATIHDTYEVGAVASNVGDLVEACLDG
jgi:glycosyltransferase involved in cell wall biosynthesis